MKITQLGHASLYAESGGLRLLIDPVFIDPHHEGMFEVFPPRKIDWDRMPPFELLILTHRHLDHFDPATLARLPRDVEVIIPQDALIERTLRRLGYSAITALDAGTVVRVGELEIVTTPSDVAFPEFGVVLRDRDGCVWNQVDTVVDDAAIDFVLDLTGGIDLLLATWQPMLETAYGYGQPLDFPMAAYATILRNLARVAPRAVAPASCGFLYRGGAEWLNHVVFPQSRERFLYDAALVLPEIAGSAFPFDPGDAIELNDGAVTRVENDTQWVHRGPRDPALIEFAPVASEVARRAAETIDARRQARIDQFIREELPRWVADHEALFDPHHRSAVIYQLEIVEPGRSAVVVIDFRDRPAAVRDGRDPLANFFCSITAAGLAGLLDGTCSWDRVILGGGFHHHHRLYGVSREGLVPPPATEVHNPLFSLFSESESFERMLDGVVEALVVERAGAIPSRTGAARDATASSINL